MTEELELKEVLNLGDKFCIPFRSIRAIRKSMNKIFSFSEPDYFVQFEIDTGLIANCRVEDEHEQDAIYKEAVVAFERWLVNKRKVNA